MPRNRELLFFILGAAAVTGTATVLCVFSRIPQGIVCATGCAGVSALFAIYSLRRYRDIAKLSAYLERLSHGKAMPDIRDSAEGELSILKSEIYKVTAALTEQAGTLAKDKLELARALADISHQLKTPLTAMSVMADLLDDDSLPAEKRRDFIANMRSSLNRMEWLVLTLLKLARLDAGAAALKRESIPLSALIELALSPLLIPLELRELTLSVSGDDADILCDAGWTCEALGNVLKNAVENTPAGGHIDVSYGANPIYSFVSVRDGGAGVDKDDLPHLFRRFYRGKNTGGSGVGIGLAISMAVMRRQNGDIEVHNDNGGVFTLKFYYR